MRILNKIIYNMIFGGWYAISLLPMWWHYLWSDILCFLVYHVVRYRRKVVRKNIADSFPQLSKRQRWLIERRFYRHFCDILVESIKYFSISPKEIKRRMQFRGLERVEQSCREGKSCAVFLGHYGNWEWISSLQLWIDPKVGKCVQLYHPLENIVFDRLTGYSRQRLGSTNIPVNESLRHIVRYKKEGVPLVIGFIFDQVPNWRNIHYWTPFLHHQQTPVFTGAERMAEKLDMDIYYMHIRRRKRGHYVATFKLLKQNPKECPEFEVTELATRELEKNINESPSYWLWSHNRWKRTHAEWEDKKAKGEI